MKINCERISLVVSSQASHEALAATWLWGGGRDMQSLVLLSFANVTILSSLKVSKYRSQMEG